MNILLIGPAETNSTDGVIVKGIKYLLNRSYPNCDITYKFLIDIIPQTPNDFNVGTQYDIVVVCGTPWLWDSFQNTDKFKNLKMAFNNHPEAKKLFMGIGTCLHLKDADSDILERPNEVTAMHEVYDNATVIVRDHLALAKLTKAGIKAALLPCPAYYAYGDEVPTAIKQYNVLIYQDPTESISKGDWQDQSKLNDYYAVMHQFRDAYNALVYCANPSDLPGAEANGFTPISVLNTVEETLELMRFAKHVLSGRVHNAVPAIVQGADTKLMALDTRSYVVTDFEHVADFKPYLSYYDKIIKSIFNHKLI